MSTRTRVLLITLTWACAAVLCALPSVWPAFRHLIGTQAYRDYQFEAGGFMTGWLTRDVLGRRRKATPVPPA